MINTNVPIVFLPLHKSLKKQTSSNAVADKKNNAVPGVKENAQKKEKITTIAKLPEKKGSNPSTSSGRAETKSKNNKKIQEQKKKEIKVETIKPKKPSESKEVSKLQTGKNVKSARPDPSASSGVNVSACGEHSRTIEGFERSKIQDPPLEQPKVVECESKLAQEIPSARPEPIEVFERNKTRSEVENTPNSPDENVLYVGQQEMDALHLQQHIQEQMSQLWQPPPGMKREVCCLIKIVVDEKGIVDAVAIAQSSGVLMFDTAACDAAMRFNPPRFAYGKEIIITFKP